MIVESIERATTEHVVFFLLTAWLDWRVRGAAEDELRGQIGHLPLTGPWDVKHRLRILRDRHDAISGESQTRAVADEAREVLHAANARLEWLRARAQGHAQRGARLKDRQGFDAPFRRAAPADLSTRQRVYR
jgi:hypothetical protein